MIEVAVYGGAFDPPHAGHARVMIEASRQARQVWVVPSFRHADGKRMADFDLRLGWLHDVVASIRPLCAAPVRVSGIERELAQLQPGPVYSYTLLERLATRLGIADRQLALVTGPDVLERLPQFHRGAALLERFAVITIDEQLDVRSSSLRQRLQQGLALPQQWLAPGLDPLNYRHYAVHGT
ncbi:cytidyltransferase [uncultured Pseudomonas sp.]|uniref:cytidyltransferase n=1 Tax=uncultured Pseudomonas sp. TaxID=114707 RepID=UPI0025EB05F0|nr:cytidyltransferase [uncultured Pseudomonas sp.]